ncbi:MAG: transcriptional regulator [Flavobacteriales bacterium]|nr:MAG: transcriptional regulator [Flavobacteriales bacterium]
MKNKELELKEIWNNKKRNDLKSFISNHSKKQSEDRLLTNKLLSIQYRMEDYIRSENDQKEIFRILDFVKMYLKVLNITKKSLAEYFEMEDSNLHKYLSGERKLNAELAVKLSSFSHTKPEQWYRVQIKNELIKFKKERKNIDDFKKYDFKNFVST